MLLSPVRRIQRVYVHLIFILFCDCAFVLSRYLNKHGQDVRAFLLVTILVMFVPSHVRAVTADQRTDRPTDGRISPHLEISGLFLQMQARGQLHLQADKKVRK